MDRDATETVDGSRPQGRRRLVATALGGMVLAALVAGLWFGQGWQVPADREPAGLISSLYDPASRPLEAALNQGDGQIFASQATDPLIRRPELFGSAEPGHHAYRWERPLYGWLGWALSGGQAAIVPEALILLTILSVGALVAAIRNEIDLGGGNGALALLILLSPGVLANLRYVGPESLATALLVFGLGTWTRRTGRGWLAVACFAGAALCRETMLLVPAALAVQAQLSSRGGGWFVWKPPVWRLASALLPLIAWIGILRLRVGAFPEPNNDTLVTPTPFSGVLAASSRWDTADLVVVFALVIPTIALLLVGRRSPFASLMYVHLIFAGFIGEAVWADDTAIGRLLLPLSAVAVIVIAGARGGAMGPTPVEHPADGSLAAGRLAGASP